MRTVARGAGLTTCGKFLDCRKVYNPAIAEPGAWTFEQGLLPPCGAGCMSANGVHVHVLPADSPRYLATPELSFTIRWLNAHGGLNISASHNPPDDNGGKFYDERGAQPVPPDDQIMSDLVEQVTQIKHLPWAEAIHSGKIHFLDDDASQGIYRLVPQAEFDRPAEVR